MPQNLTFLSAVRSDGPEQGPMDWPAGGRALQETAQCQRPFTPGRSWCDRGKGAQEGGRGPWLCSTLPTMCAIRKAHEHTACVEAHAPHTLIHRNTQTSYLRRDTPSATDNTDVQVPNMQTCHLPANTHAEKGSCAPRGEATQDACHC